MNDLLKIKVRELTRTELSYIGGGSASIAGADVFECSCSNGPGEWTGNYGTQERADQSLNDWCEGGQGSCEKK